MKAYLAGPMRGYPAFNFPAFMDAAERLTLAGLEVFNPAGQDTDAGYDFSACDGTEDLASLGFDLRDALAADLSFITLNAEALVALPGWEGSLGATAEVHAALALGLLVWEYDADATLSLVDWLHESIEQAQKAAEPDLGPKTCEDDECELCLRLKQDRGEIEMPAGPRWVDYNGARYLAPPPASGTPWEGWQDLGYMTEEPGAEPFTRPQNEFAAFRARAESEPGYAGEPQTGEVRTTSLTGGEKGDKPARFDLIPAGPLWSLAELYGAGARKYADRNWERGYAWHLSFAAMMRHAWLFWQGENVDAETGSPHLASVVFHAFALMEWEVTHPEYDDRPSTPKE
jgi:hypothetical protein